MDGDFVNIFSIRFIIRCQRINCAVQNLHFMISVLIIIFGPFFSCDFADSNYRYPLQVYAVLRTRLTQRIFLIFICYDSKSNCSIIVSHFTT